MLVILAIAAGGLLLGVFMVPFSEMERRERAADRIQRRWLAMSRSRRRRAQWRNREDPTSVMGRTTAWDNGLGNHPPNYYHGYNQP